MVTTRVKLFYNNTDYYALEAEINAFADTLDYSVGESIIDVKTSINKDTKYMPLSRTNGICKYGDTHSFLATVIYNKKAVK